MKEGKLSPFEVEVFIDTGATQVLLPKDLVKRLGLGFLGKQG